MTKMRFLVLCGCMASLSLVGCQSTSQQFNGQSGYEVEEKTATSAILRYTLATSSANAESLKLQDACKQILGAQKTYQINILSSQEIVNPSVKIDSSNIKLGSSNTSFGFSNTPNLNNNQESYAARQVEETRPSMLKIVRFNCS